MIRRNGSWLLMITLVFFFSLLFVTVSPVKQSCTPGEFLFKTTCLQFWLWDLNLVTHDHLSTIFVSLLRGESLYLTANSFQMSIMFVVMFGGYVTAILPLIILFGNSEF